MDKSIVFKTGKGEIFGCEISPINGLVEFLDGDDEVIFTITQAQFDDIVKTLGFQIPMYGYLDTKFDEIKKLLGA